MDTNSITTSGKRYTSGRYAETTKVVVDSEILVENWTKISPHLYDLLNLHEFKYCISPAFIQNYKSKRHFTMYEMLMRWLAPYSPWICQAQCGTKNKLFRIYAISDGRMFSRAFDPINATRETPYHGNKESLLLYEPNRFDYDYLRYLIHRSHLHGNFMVGDEHQELLQQFHITPGLPNNNSYDTPTLFFKEIMEFQDLVSHFQDEVPLVVNLPHTSIDIPQDSNFLLPPYEINRLAYQSADLYTDKMLDEQVGIIPVIAPVSRIVVDTERFVDDELESAAKFGAGVVYTKGYDGSVLRHSPTDKEKQELLDLYYYPHHERLTMHIYHSLRLHGKARLLDLHSYPESYDMPGATPGEKPDVCIGFEEFHSNPLLIDKLAECCRKYGLSVGLNTPFSGALVPSMFYQKDSRVYSVMLEIKRSLYMDEQSMKLTDGFDTIRKFVADCADIIRRS